MGGISTLTFPSDGFDKDQHTLTKIINEYYIT